LNSGANLSSPEMLQQILLLENGQKRNEACQIGNEARRRRNLSRAVKTIVKWIFDTCPTTWLGLILAVISMFPAFTWGNDRGCPVGRAATRAAP